MAYGHVFCLYLQGFCMDDAFFAAIYTTFGASVQHSLRITMVFLSKINFCNYMQWFGYLFQSLGTIISIDRWIFAAIYSIFSLRGDFLLVFIMFCDIDARFDLYLQSIMRSICGFIDNCNTFEASSRRGSSNAGLPRPSADEKENFFKPKKKIHSNRKILHFSKPTNKT